MSGSWKRQDRRKTGQFDKLNPCEKCGKSAGEDYYSDDRCNRTGVGVVLCRKCAMLACKIESDVEYIAFFKRKQ